MAVRGRDSSCTGTCKYLPARSSVVVYLDACQERSYYIHGVGNSVKPSVIYAIVQSAAFFQKDNRKSSLAR